MSELRCYTLRDGTVLSYAEEGNGTPIVFVPGNCGTKEGFIGYVAPFVQAGYRVIRPDMRGMGKSVPSKTHPVTLDLLSEDLCEFMEGLDLRDAVLAGHSMGGMLVMGYAKRRGCSRLKAAVLMDCTCLTYKKEDWAYANNNGSFTYEMGMAAIQEAKRDFRGSFRAFLSSTMPDASEEVVNATVNQIFTSVEEQSMAELYPTVFLSDYRDCLPALTVPTAYVFADRPEAIVAYKITDFYRAAVNGPYESIPFDTNDHSFILSQTEEISRRVLTFLNGLGS